METTKRLYRSKTDKIIGGVCGGIANYFNIDPVIVRLLCVALLLINGISLIAYIITWIVMPMEKLKVAEPEMVEAKPESEVVK
jgi:phage shock protein PspC (stress-responsive transcriptional regulator)